MKIDYEKGPVFVNLLKRIPFEPTTICRICQNQDTKRIIDTMELKEYLNVFKNNNFRVYSCYCCGAEWGFEI